MFNEKTLDKFLDLYPISDYGKIWSRLTSRAPTRTTENGTSIASLAWVAVSQSDRVIPDLIGVVYKTPQGPVIFWPMHADGAAKDSAEARYVMDRNILKQARDGWINYDRLGYLGDVASVEDMEMFKCAFYGDLRDGKLVPLRKQ